MVIEGREITATFAWKGSRGQSLFADKKKKGSRGQRIDKKSL